LIDKCIAMIVRERETLQHDTTNFLQVWACRYAQTLFTRRPHKTISDNDDDDDSSDGSGDDVPASIIAHNWRVVLSSPIICLLREYLSLSQSFSFLVYLHSL